MLAWERQENESARAYEAFSLYRDLGPQRSVAKVAETLSKSRSLVSRWSAKHGWVDRVKALEARDAMIAREALEAHMQGKAEDFAEREVKLREQALEIREAAAQQALRMAAWPLAEQRVIREDENGNPVEVVLQPAGWSKATAVAYFNMVIGTPPSEPSQEEEAEFDLSHMSDEELAEFIRLNEKAQEGGLLPPGDLSPRGD